MNMSRFKGSFAVAIAVLIFTSCLAAHADTYTGFDLGTGYRRAPLGITASGVVVVYASVGECSVGFSGCWETWVNGARISESTVNPGLVYDDGTPCTPTASPVFGGNLTAGVCNNGREIYGTTRYAPSPYVDTIFDGPNPATDLVATGYELDSVLLNSSGDFVFVANEGFSDGEIYEAVDLTTDVTPEPASLLLLGTGVLAVLGATRRRLLAAR